MNILHVGSMRKSQNTDFLKYLSRPRNIQEIVKHFGVSRKTAIFHLQKAIMSGDVLVNRTHLFQTVKDSSANLGKLADLVYAYHKSSTLARNNTGFLSFEKRETSKFPSRTGPGKWMTSPEPSHSLLSKLNKASSRVVTESRSRYRHMSAPQFQKPNNSKSKSLQCKEKIDLFRSLLDKPLPFLDLHERFSISRHVVAGLVKRGLLEENWSSDGVGVSFSLTSEGKKYLKELTTRSAYKPSMKYKSLTKMKQRFV
jgi:hypothetical protein